MTTEFTFATLDHLEQLRKNSEHHHNYNHYHWNHSRTGPWIIDSWNDETPWGYSAEGCMVKMGWPAQCVTVKPVHFSNQPYTYYFKQPNYYQHNTQPQPTAHFGALKKQPFFLLIQRQGYRYDNDEKSRFKPNDRLMELAKSATEVHFLGAAESYYYSDGLKCSNIAIKVKHKDVEFFCVMPWEVAEQAFGLAITEDMELILDNGTTGKFDRYDRILTGLNAHRGNSWQTKLEKFDFTFDTLNEVTQRAGMGHANVGRFLKALVKKGWKNVADIKMSGIAKTWNRLEPVAQQVLESDPLTYCGYRSFAASSSRSIDGVKISAVFNDVFKDVTDKEGFIKALRDFHGGKSKKEVYSGRYYLEECVKKLEIYKEKRKAVLKSQANRAFTKIMEEAESLTIDKKKHKLTWAKIEAGELPLGTFFRKSEQYYLLNDNWDLWEEMFKRGYGEQAIELANEVKGRSTYEKDLMSYFYFVLYGLPEFLKKHTGHKWTGIPKLVNSADELEPPKEEGGVARKRSALTPIVDNDNHTVTVPYASLAIYGGFGTTYCYSHDYHVLTKGYSLNGYAVTNEIEKGLNGRDDYGLMFYTLTGSAQGRGYPTFLIIFERRSQKGDTKVHFHRTHPSRSKDGDYNPIHNWIKVCYNWMAGNIKADRIKAQQGDLAFVQVKTEDSGEELDGAAVKNLKFDHKVNQYDNHCFEEPVPFAEYTKAAKSNVLGYVQLEKETWLRHNEHDDVLIPAGTYAIHQCRSWEANPKGVWSLRID